MNELIAPTVNSLCDAFNTYQIDNAELQTEVDAFKQKLINFAENNDDITTFYTNYADSGLQEEYSALITKVAMAANVGSSNTETNDSSSLKIESLPSVDQFLEQYRLAYNELCKRKSVAGRAAYEKLFDVADRAEDILDAQIIIERERLLWRIVADDAIEIFENKLDEMDPLNKPTTAKLLGQVEVYNNVDGDEELGYAIDKQEVKDIGVIADYVCKMNLVLNLSLLLIKYIKVKQELYEWHDNRHAKAVFEAMVENRRKLKFLINFLDEALNLSFDEICADEGLKIWLLNPKNVDEYGRKKTCIDLRIIDVFRDIIQNEIFTDLTIKEILLR